jgi:rhamnosyltransferase
VHIVPTESPLNSHREARTHPDVCAVMVTYNPELSFEQNVRDLLPQVGKLIIVDNQSSSVAHSLIRQAASNHEVEVIWNERNLGIAGALNRGINRALASGEYRWIATFDQDSHMPSDYLTTIIESYSTCPFRDKVAMIGATYTSPSTEFVPDSMSARNGCGFREVKTLMMSGSLVKSSAFGECGRFDQSLFMDCVDHEFCLRLRRHGFRVIQAKQALLAHQPGSPTSHRILWKRFTTTNHSPSRRYYNAHNRLVVYRRYLSSELLWVLADVFDWFRDVIKLVLFERNRTQKLASIAKGTWAAMLEPLPARPDTVDGSGPGVDDR